MAVLYCGFAEWQFCTVACRSGRFALWLDRVAILHCGFAEWQSGRFALWLCRVADWSFCTVALWVK